jgi:hypothetical protein
MKPVNFDYELIETNETTIEYANESAWDEDQL